MPAYPNIPLPDQQFSSKTETPVSRTNMEGGISRQTILFATGQKTANCQWTLTNEEYALFQEFFHTDLNSGVDFFTMPLPTIEGVQDVSVRFVGGIYQDRYKSHDTWVISATLEMEIVQLIDAPEIPLSPVWFQPERNIFIDTLLDQEYANNKLVLAPATGTSIVLTVPPVSSPSDWLPFGILNKGPGNVIVKLLEEVVEPPDPADTWMELAILMNAWGVYRFDTGVVLRTGGLYTGVHTVADLSGNLRTLEDTFLQGGDYKAGTIVDGWVVSNAPAISGMRHNSFRGYHADLNLTNYHVLAVQKLLTPLQNGSCMQITQQAAYFSPRTDFGVATASPPRWGVHANGGGGYGGNAALKAPNLTDIRLIELCGGDSDELCAYVNGSPVYQTNSRGAANMTCLQFGGGTLKEIDSGGCNTQTAAAIIFDRNLNSDTLENQVNLAILRKLMLTEYL